MPRKVIIMMEVDDNVTDDELHESLVTVYHEGATSVLAHRILDIQVIGEITNTD